MQEPDRLGPVDPNGRLVDVGVRPLQPCAATRNEVGPGVRCGPEQQTPCQRGFGEVVMIAVEDVPDPGAMDIPLNHKEGCQVKTDAAPEKRRMPLFGVGVAEPGAADRTKDDGLTLLSPYWHSEQKDT